MAESLRNSLESAKCHPYGMLHGLVCRISNFGIKPMLLELEEDVTGVFCQTHVEKPRFHLDSDELVHVCPGDVVYHVLKNN